MLVVFYFWFLQVIIFLLFSSKPPSFPWKQCKFSWINVQGWYKIGLYRLNVVSQMVVVPSSCSLLQVHQQYYCYSLQSKHHCTKMSFDRISFGANLLTKSGKSNRGWNRVLNRWSWINLGQMHRFSRFGHRGHWQVAHKPSFMCHLSVSPEPELEKLCNCPKVIQLQK